VHAHTQAWAPRHTVAPGMVPGAPAAHLDPLARPAGRRCGSRARVTICRQRG
jgi:hypothetical protein